jgi:hypothetical protein
VPYLSIFHLARADFDACAPTAIVGTHVDDFRHRAFRPRIIADRDGFWNGRTGNANPLLYLLYNADYHGFFHDITGIGQSVDNNGLFPTTPGYDLATGIGTPNIGAIITDVPEP